MSNYIEFTTAPEHPYVWSTFGFPVYTGSRPTTHASLRGVRVDSQVVEFTDESIPERLLRTIVESKDLPRRGIPFNCVTFAALMFSVELRDGHHNPFVEVNDRIVVNSDDSSQQYPVLLGNTVASNPIYEITEYRHNVVPAYQKESTTYLHKLGDAGPICLSGLSGAMSLYRCTVAHPTAWTPER